MLYNNNIIAQHHHTHNGLNVFLHHYIYNADHAVWVAERDARIEYRIAHPPKFMCPQLHCSKSFATREAMKAHIDDTVEHAEYDLEHDALLDKYVLIKADVARMRQTRLCSPALRGIFIIDSFPNEILIECSHCVSVSALTYALLPTSLNQIKHHTIRRYHTCELFLAGPHGRMVSANRLLYSKELASLKMRIQSVQPTPFRPRTLDPDNNRQAQQIKGMLVQGYDPKAGVRAGYRKKGMRTQHLCPGRRADQPVLQDVISSLLHCRDEQIDIVRDKD